MVLDKEPTGKKNWGRTSGSFVRQLRGAHCHVTMSWRRWVRWISSGTRSHGWSILAGVCVCNEWKTSTGGGKHPTPPPPPSNRINWNLIRLAHFTLMRWFQKMLSTARRRRSEWFNTNSRSTIGDEMKRHRTVGDDRQTWNGRRPMMKTPPSGLYLNGFIFPPCGRSASANWIETEKKNHCRRFCYSASSNGSNSTVEALQVLPVTAAVAAATLLAPPFNDDRQWWTRDRMASHHHRIFISFKEKSKQKNVKQFQIEFTKQNKNDDSAMSLDILYSGPTVEWCYIYRPVYNNIKAQFFV